MRLMTILAATACLFLGACHTTGKQCSEKGAQCCSSCGCEQKQCKEKNNY